jgi:hypothetical protein
MTLPFRVGGNDEEFRRSARAAGYSEAEINSYLETENRTKAAAQPTPVQAPQGLLEKIGEDSKRQGQIFNKGFFGGLSRTAGTVEKVSDMAKAVPGMMGGVAGAVSMGAGKLRGLFDSQIEEPSPAPANQGTFDKVADKLTGFAGAVAGELPVALGVSGALRGVAGVAALKTTSPFAQRLLTGNVPGSFFKSAAASAPINMVEGLMTDAIVYPEQVMTKEGVLRSAALGAVGAFGDGLRGMLNPAKQLGPNIPSALQRKLDPLGTVLAEPAAPTRVPFWKKLDQEVFDPAKPFKDMGDWQDSNSAWNLARRLAGTEDQIHLIQNEKVFIPQSTGGYVPGKSVPTKELVSMVGDNPEVLRDWDKYLLGKSEIPLSVDAADVARQVTELEAKYPHFEKLLPAYKAKTDDLVDMMRGYNLIDDDAASAMKSSELMYVPTGRQVDNEFRTADFLKEKTNTQSLREIVSPMQQIFEMERKIVRRGEMNKLGNSILTEVGINKNRWKGALEVLDQNVSNAPIEREMGRLEAAFKLNNQPIPSQKELRALAEISSDELLDGTNGTLRVMRDGVPVDIRVSDPMVLEFYKNRKFVEPGNAAKAFQATERFTTRTFFQPFRELTGKNAALDQFEAFMNTKWNEYVPGWDFARGVWAEVTKDPRLQQIRLERGAVATRYANANLYESASRYEDFVKQANKKGIKVHFTTPLQPMHELMGILSSGTRNGAALRKLAATGDAAAAANMSRNVIADPQQRGTAQLVKALSYSSFANYALQSTRRTMQAASDSPVTFATKGLVSVTVPAALLWMRNKDDDEIQELRKSRGGENFFYLRMPQSQEIYAFQKPYLPGALFGTSVESFLDGMDPKAAETFAKSLVDNMIPNPVPVTAGLAAELTFGKNFFGFFENPIPLSPSYTQGALPEDVAGQNTFGFSKILAEKTGFDAAKIDNTIKTILFSQATDVFDRIDRKVFNRMAPEVGFTFLPAAKKVNPNRSNVETLNNFYDNYNELKKVGTSFDIAMAEGRPERLQQLVGERKEEILKYEMYDAMNEVFGVINNQIRITVENRFLSPEERRERVTNLRKMMINKAKAFNQLVEGVE